MIPETFEFIDDITQQAKQRDMDVLVEIHSFYKTQIAIAKKVDYVYDFALPVLVLDALFHADARRLGHWLRVRPENAITVLDTHDGIGIVDVAGEDGQPGLVPDVLLDAIVEKIHANSKGTSLKATGAAASNLDLYQVNCTYFDALGQDERHYFLARAIQFFVPGIPQVYYVGLFAGNNDMELLERTNVGRDINRHYFGPQEIRAALETGFSKSFQKLLRLRNTHPAFSGSFTLREAPTHALSIIWEQGSHNIGLELDLRTREFTIKGSMEGMPEHVYFDGVHGKWPF